MLNPALLTLMKLQARGTVRRGLRGTRTLKGKLLLAFAVVVGLLWLGPAVMSSFVMPRADPQTVRTALPLMLLAMTLLSAVAHGGDRAVAFTPAEANFLFPGPFTRRELLTYKIAKAAAGAVLTAAFMSVLLLRYATLWPACFAGLLLSLLFLQFTAMAVVMLRITVSEATRASWRRVILIAAAVALAAALAPAAAAAMRMDWPQMQAAVQESRAARVLLAPVKPFAMTLTAQRYAPDLLAWGALAAAIDAALLALLFRLDANLLEVSLAATGRIEAQLARVRGGQAMGVAKSARLRVPPLPRLGGAGAVAWRQLTTIARTGRGMLVLLAILAGGAVPAMAAARGRDLGPDALLPLLLWMTILVAAMLKFDFRGDLDRMDSLKALPIRPAAVAAGQLATPVLVLAAFHLVAFGIVAAMAGGASAGRTREVLLWAAAVALPFDLLLIGVENLVFLLAPARPAAATPGDLSAMGRHALLFIVKVFVLLVPCGVSAALAAAAYFAAGRSPTAAGAVAVVTLALQAAAVVPLVGWAFRRFDPSVDTPA